MDDSKWWVLLELLLCGDVDDYVNAIVDVILMYVECVAGLYVKLAGVFLSVCVPCESVPTRDGYVVSPLLHQCILQSEHSYLHADSNMQAEGS